MRPELYGHSFKKARSVNQTSATFVSKVSTTTEPTGTGSTATNSSVIDLRSPGNDVMRSVVKILLYGTGNDNDTFSCQVIGWTLAGSGLWVPTVLCQLQGTLSTAVGVAGAYVVDTERFADAITVTFGNANVSVEVPTVPANTIAIAKAALVDSQKLELSFTTGGSATGCNALVAVF